MPESHYKCYVNFVAVMDGIRSEYTSTIRDLLITRQYTKRNPKNKIRNLQKEFVKKANFSVASFLVEIIRETEWSWIEDAETAELWATDVAYKYPMDSEENFLPLPLFDAKISTKLKYTKDEKPESVAREIQKNVNKLCFPRTKSQPGNYIWEDFTWMSFFDTVRFMLFRDTKRKIIGFALFDFEMLHDFQDEDECEVIVSFLKIGETGKIKMVNRDYDIVEESVFVHNGIKTGDDFAILLDYLGISEKLMKNLELFGIEDGNVGKTVRLGTYYANMLRI